MSNAESRPAPVILVVLDGWGWRTAAEGNAIALAHTPTWDRLIERTPWTLLDASGVAVGLPEGQMGNSEVGHLNLGAGRVVRQDLVRINQSIDDGSFGSLPVLRQLADSVRQSGGTLHLAGLLGSGGVHAIDTHLAALIATFAALGVPRIAIHGFLDGRDAPPTAGPEVISALQADIARHGAGRTVLASLVGRYFAMDRDRRWDRTRLAWELLIHGVGTPAGDPVAAVRAAHARGETDEFVRPIILTGEDGNPLAPMREGDAVFFVNYRSDRMRQIAAALCLDSFDGFEVTDRPSLKAATLTQYDQTFPFPAAFEPMSMARILAEELSLAGRSQFRTAETEKYPHVTYFFNGGNEVPWNGEERELVPSQQVATYDLAPEMSAAGITDTLVRALGRGDHDFFLANLANADMVGHTGVMPAVIRAVETVDQSLTRIVAAAEASGARLLVTADHGNAEQMIDPATGGPHTAHTTNPVPFLAVDRNTAPLRGGGALCDVAPTILHLLGLPQPEQMTGRSLLDRMTA
ncbi:MAG: 2,3-bisphosphoglycerate-independent phosphoglycerate mutase [Gemmatimonadales bacterium]|nr:2,3-bisphosphoglycerate-independent phosphoglycerate mutase [Gemmatimonadales bacterium]MDZ4390940.1 2,3-bisphosphoglycerate-independent phosphoglycerate mutase [Gemmatimonadales bacterium]